MCQSVCLFVCSTHNSRTTYSIDLKFGSYLPNGSRECSVKFRGFWITNTEDITKTSIYPFTVLLPLTVVATPPVILIQHGSSETLGVLS